MQDKEATMEEFTAEDYDSDQDVYRTAANQNDEDEIE